MKDYGATGPPALSAGQLSPPLFVAAGEMWCRQHAPPHAGIIEASDWELFLALAYCRTGKELAAIDADEKLWKKVAMLFDNFF